jgi:hypothetical protein
MLNSASKLLFVKRPFFRHLRANIDNFLSIFVHCLIVHFLPAKSGKRRSPLAMKFLYSEQENHHRFTYFGMVQNLNYLLYNLVTTAN